LEVSWAEVVAVMRRAARVSFILEDVVEVKWSNARRTQADFVN
jgi:hypothetical protein